jgi:glycerol-3-phosphate acyltransferase PlsY
LNVVLAALIAAAIVVYRHKENMRRMRAGKEPVFRWGT